MDAAEAADIARQLEELKEAAHEAKLAERKLDIKAAMAGHKTAGAKRMVRVHFVMVLFLGFHVGFG